MIFTDGKFTDQVYNINNLNAILSQAPSDAQCSISTSCVSLRGQKVIHKKSFDISNLHLALLDAEAAYSRESRDTNRAIRCTHYIQIRQEVDGAGYIIEVAIAHETTQMILSQWHLVDNTLCPVTTREEIFTLLADAYGIDINESLIR